MSKAKDCVMKCQNCAFYRAQRDEDGRLEEYGRCHRYPPVMVPEAEMHSFDFPTVNEEDFCGEWQQGRN